MPTVIEACPVHGVVCPVTELEKSIIELRMGTAQLNDVIQHTAKKAAEALTLSMESMKRVDGAIMWLKGLLVAKFIVISLIAYVLTTKDSDVRRIDTNVDASARLIERHTAILDSHSQTLLTLTNQLQRQMDLTMTLVLKRPPQ